MKGKMPPRRMSPQQLGFQGRVSIAPNILPGVKHSDLKAIVCNNCGADTFHPAHKLMVASRFQSVNGMPTLVQVPLGFACDACDKINPFDEKDFAGAPDAPKKTEPEGDKGGDLGINVAEDVKTVDKPTG